MSKKAKRARFYREQRNQRRIARYMGIMSHLMAVHLGCPDRPWFTLTVPKLSRARTHLERP